MSIIQKMKCRMDNHQWSDWEFTPGTCQQQRECTYCHFQASRTKPHQYQWEWEDEEKSCNRHRICLQCGHIQEIRQEEHLWGDWANIAGSTDQVRSCTRCQTQETRPQPPRSRHDTMGFGSLIEIAAGAFLMGTNPDDIPMLMERYGGWREDYEEEIPEHEVTLQTFWIGKTPVTVSQFRTFVKKSGYNWRGSSEKQGKGDHPVIQVTWHDAQAYCEWLTEEWRASEFIHADEVVQLPSEAEWEKAARGVNGRIFPFGDEPTKAQLNMFNSTAEINTPVGSNSPLGDSPYGCVDVVGNVFQWTRSLGKEEVDSQNHFSYPYVPDDKRENLSAQIDIPRSIRGSTKDSEPHGHRAATRASYHTSVYCDHVGFRVCVITMEAGTQPYTRPQEDIVGFKAALDIIFDQELESLPVLTDSQLAQKKWDGSLFSSVYQGTAKEMHNLLLDNIDSSIESNIFNILVDHKFENIQLLMKIPNGWEIVAIIYNTKTGVRAILNKSLSGNL